MKAISQFVLACLALGVLFPESLGAQSTLRREVAGEWRQVTVYGPFPWKQRPQCQVYGWTERVLLLFPVPGANSELRGQWSKHFSAIWLANNGEQCRWEDETQFQSFADSNVSFAVQANLGSEGDSLQVTAKFTQCRGRVCPTFAPNSAKPDSQTFPLRIENGRLVDRGNPKETLIFERTADAESALQEATDTFNQLKQFMSDSGGPETLDRFAAQVLLPPRDQTIRIQSQVGKIVQRVPLTSLMSTTTWVNPSDGGPFAFFVELLENEKGQPIGEYILLKREGPTWKLVSVVYG